MDDIFKYTPTKELISRDSIVKAMEYVTDDTTCPLHISAEIHQNLEMEPAVEAIPIAVIRRAISGINAADSCDQTGQYERELRSALEIVLKWYDSPNYKEYKERTALC